MNKFDNFLNKAGNVKIGKNNRLDKVNRVLVIGDLHEPFSLDKYLDHCYSVYKKYRCNVVVFTGDIIDNHYSSYHETDPDGYSAGEELNRAIDRLSKWYAKFPNAIVLIGNHDRIVCRKAFTGGVSKTWIRDYKDVLNTPRWNFVEDIVIDNTLYCHGEGKKARTRAKDELTSVVQGHYHSDSYVEYFVGSNYKIFAMQSPCGVDKESYAMAYGKHFKKPAIGCSVVIDGKKAYLEMMEL